MDSYMTYERRLRALNQGTQARIFVMPLSACIAQETITRVCETELFKCETEVTETEWREYFLASRFPDPMTHKRLDSAMNSEDVVHDDPKKVVNYLVEALRPPAFRSAIKDQLGQPKHKPKKRSLQSFLMWLRPEPPKPPTKPGQQPPKAGPTNLTVDGRKAPRPQTSTALRPTKKPDAKPPQEAPDRGCFKCGDEGHGVFQCPQISGGLEAKELYESRTGEKVRQPIAGAAALPGPAPRVSPALPCVVMETVKADITPDSGAEVTVVAPSLLDKLRRAGVWLSSRDLPDNAAVAGIGGEPTPVKKKVRLDLRFNTPGGALVLRNVVGWVTTHALPTGMGELLLSRPVMQQVYDMSDLDATNTGGMHRVLALASSADLWPPRSKRWLSWRKKCGHVSQSHRRVKLRRPLRQPCSRKSTKHKTKELRAATWITCASFCCKMSMCLDSRSGETHWWQCHPWRSCSSPTRSHSGAAHVGIRRLIAIF
ncbi:TPA: hypothetical protein N0F65_001786 [Lagenidium giganteum]|uniref:CCHC-type domain-containing protein n=1 Tax=Lagenidium giganteum TaxID=4803 RepID=A0AAV2Z4F9_9STRA|nr:TPA: hypothetical protein N0F65_001786 [Lagenidium giganteum]